MNNLFMALFLKTSSLYSIFKTFNSTLALQVGFLKHLGDVATVLLDLSPSRFFLFLHVTPDRLDDDQIRSLCGALAVVTGLLQLMAK